ncbi:addiction module toxin RelE [Serratia liquefaciens]|nr:addiction module toxin RelE [Serratia liquefaciens]HCR63292.1 addiction module toxin RelE [Serratia liquefaciens]
MKGIYPMDFKLQPGAQLTHPQGLTQVSDWGSECREQRCSLKDDGYNNRNLI